MAEQDALEAARTEKRAEQEGVPEGEVIYRSVRQDGKRSLTLTSAELAWSGLAGGLSMGFTLIGEGLLRAHVPETAWAPLVTKFGDRVFRRPRRVRARHRRLGGVPPRRVFTGERTMGDYLGRLLVPALTGNAIGGVAFVATLAHAQHGPE